MQTFKLEIDADQLKILVSALIRFPKTEVSEVELLEMLEQIPEIEAGSPGILHSLCS